MCTAKVLSADALLISWWKLDIDMHHLWLLMLVSKQVHSCHLDSMQPMHPFFQCSFCVDRGELASRKDMANDQIGTKRGIKNVWFRFISVHTWDETEVILPYWPKIFI